jgi:hypothetical protein
LPQQGENTAQHAIPAIAPTIKLVTTKQTTHNQASTQTKPSKQAEKMKKIEKNCMKRHARGTQTHTQTRAQMDAFHDKS